MTHIAYLSMGSNIGDTKDNLTKGIAKLISHPEISLEEQSSDYRTSPVGGVKQDDFLNLAVKITTSLTPYELLAYIHQVEAALHRKRLIHWGARTLDIDIVFFDDRVSEDPDLTLPHPEVWNRLFVLVPIQEIMSADFHYYHRVNQRIDELQQTEQSIERIGNSHE